VDTVEFFLRMHAVVHSYRVAKPEAGWSMLEAVLKEAPEADLRATPLDRSSIVWALWHTARIEDVAANVIIAGRPQVLDEGAWTERMRLDFRDVGTNMSKESMKQLSRDVEIPALLGYHDAVGLRTREVAAALSPARWSELYGPEESGRVAAAGALIPEAAWLDQFWTGNSMAWFLYWVCTEHSVMHLNSGRTVRSLLRLT
jgi:hypothetical protein